MRYANGMARKKVFNFIVIVQQSDGNKMRVPIRTRHQLARYLNKVAKSGTSVCKLEVMTWEQAASEGQNPWA